MGESRKRPAWRLGRTGPAEWLALAVLALFLAAVHAFEVGDGHTGLRVVYWLICLLGGGAIGAAIEPVLEKVPWLAARPRWRALAQIVVMTVPITVLVWAVTAALADGGWGLGWLVGYFPNVLVIDAAVVVLAWLLRRALRPPLEVRAASAAPPANPLAGRLAPKLARAPLIAVQAEDHYLRVYTQAGEALVYMRFADAMEAVARGDGLRVHHSWWVARSAVETVRWRNGRGELTLAGGLKVPVSRSYAAAVRGAAWVEG